MVQLNEDLLEQLDRRATREGVSRSSLIRQAVEGFLAADRRTEIDRRIVEGYRRTPQGTEEETWARRAAREAISEEPW